MLARRFTIVCLIVAIFGMAMAILVAEAERRNLQGRGASLSDCMKAGLTPCGTGSTTR